MTTAEWAFTDALIALQELDHQEVAEKLRQRWPEVPGLDARITAAEAGLEPTHCPECGLEPLYYRDQHGQTIVVDACFGGLLGTVLNACCGHGGRKPAYIRVSNGTRGCVSVCGGRVMAYDEYAREQAS